MDDLTTVSKLKIEDVPATQSDIILLKDKVTELNFSIDKLSTKLDNYNLNRDSACVIHQNKTKEIEERLDAVEEKLYGAITAGKIIYGVTAFVALIVGIVIKLLVIK